jgi:hypothetical protein
MMLFTTIFPASTKVPHAEEANVLNIVWINKW